MASRTYDRILECGCMVSSDGGGGLIPCHAEWGNDKKHLELHEKCWEEWKKTKDYKKHLKECVERNS